MALAMIRQRIYRETTDARHVHRERTALFLAPAESTAQDGTLASMIRDKIVMSQMPVPVVRSPMQVTTTPALIP